MTKRFILLDTGCDFLVKDTLKNESIYDDDVVECLNNLHEENEQLKQQCKDFMEMLDDMCIAYLVNDGLEEILND